MANGDSRRLNDQGVICWRSARCQWAYWDNGDLRIVNYLTRETFAANPVALEVVRFFSSPRTIRDAMVGFDAYTPESVGETILKLIDAQLLLRCDSPEWARDELLASSWAAWLPGGAYHFLTKDAAYFGSDWTLEQKLQTIPRTPQPEQFKRIEPVPRGTRTFFSRRCASAGDRVNSRRPAYRSIKLQSSCIPPGACKRTSTPTTSVPCRSRRVLRAARDTP